MDYDYDDDDDDVADNYNRNKWHTKIEYDNKCMRGSKRRGVGTGRDRDGTKEKTLKLT